VALPGSSSSDGLVVGEGYGFRATFDRVMAQARTSTSIAQSSEAQRTPPKKPN